MYGVPNKELKLVSGSKPKKIFPTPTTFVNGYKNGKIAVLIEGLYILLDSGYSDSMIRAKHALHVQ